MGGLATDMTPMGMEGAAAGPTATQTMGANVAMSGTQQATTAAMGMMNPAQGPEFSPAMPSNLQGIMSPSPIQRARPMQQASAMDPGRAAQMREELLGYENTDGLALGAGALRGFGGAKGKGAA